MRAFEPSHGDSRMIYACGFASDPDVFSTEELFCRNAMAYFAFDKVIGLLCLLMELVLLLDFEAPRKGRRSVNSEYYI